MGAGSTRFLVKVAGLLLGFVKVILLLLLSKIIKKASNFFDAFVTHPTLDEIKKGLFFKDAPVINTPLYLGILIK